MNGARWNLSPLRTSTIAWVDIDSCQNHTFNLHMSSKEQSRTNKISYSYILYPLYYICLLIICFMVWISLQLICLRYSIFNHPFLTYPITQSLAADKSSLFGSFLYREYSSFSLILSHMCVVNRHIHTFAMYLNSL